jgi:preprotein translocase subunit SecF
MAFGIVGGTFSSIYVASPVLLWIESRWPGEDARGARTLGARAPTPAPAGPTAPVAPKAPTPGPRVPAR